MPLGGTPLTDRPTDVVTGQVAHSERTHGKSELLHRAIHLLGQAAFLEEEIALRAIPMQHAIANEAVTDARYNRELADLLRELHGRGEYVFGSGLAAHDLEQPHDVGGAEEVQPDHISRPACEVGDLIDVER